MAIHDLTPQLRTRLRRAEKLVGLFVALATLLLVAGFVYYLYHTAQREGWFVVKVPCETEVSSAEGLAVGDPVVMMGFPVGEITLIEANPPEAYYPVFVGFNIRDKYTGYVWTDSKLKVTSAGFLGKRRLEIVKGYDGKPRVIGKKGQPLQVLVKGEYKPLTEVKSVYLPPTEEPALTERAEKLVAQVEAALPNILVLTNQLATVLSNTTIVTANAAQLMANTDKLVIDARPLVQTAQGMVTELQAQLAVTLDGVNTNLNILTSSLNMTLLNLADITSNLNAQVQSNDRILSEISDLVIQADETLQGLKRHWLLKGAFPTDRPEPAKQLLEPQREPLQGDK